MVQLADHVTAWFDEVLVPQLLAMAAACEQAMRAYVAAWEPVVVELYKTLQQVDGLALLAVDECEPAFRAYARGYNARHPGQRISWRRLTRHERQAAAWAWLAAKK